MGDRITVTQDLLARYQADACTREERDAVEEWLADHTFPRQIDFPDNKTGDLIWKAMAEKRIAQEKPVLRFGMRRLRAIAASVVAILSIGGWFFIQPRNGDVSVRLSSNMNNVVGGLEIKPLEETEAFFKIGQEHYNGEIQFCKMFLVKNLKDYAQKIKLNVGCQEDIFPNNFVFQPGTSYIVVIGDEYNSPDARQLYVTPTDGLRRLPKGVELRVRQRMEQITI